MFKKGAEVTKTEKVLTAGSIVGIIFSVGTLVATELISRSAPYEVRDCGLMNTIKYLQGKEADGV